MYSGGACADEAESALDRHAGRIAHAVPLTLMQPQHISGVISSTFVQPQGLWHGAMAQWWPTF